MITRLKICHSKRKS